MLLCDPGYDWRVPIETSPFNPPSNLQLIGGLLARKLRDRRVLSADEANQLLLAWNFDLE
jgi:hypothetical protein